MSAEKLAGWTIFSIFCFTIGKGFAPYADGLSHLEIMGGDFSPFKLHFSRTVSIIALLGSLSIFWPLVERYKVLRYPVWLALSPLIIFAGAIIRELIASWLELWKGIDNPAFNEARSEADLVVYIGCAIALNLVILLGIFGKPRSE